MPILQASASASGKGGRLPEGEACGVAPLIWGDPESRSSWAPAGTTDLHPRARPLSRHALRSSLPSALLPRH